MEHNVDNVEELAQRIVEDWDLETLQAYAESQLANHYMDNEQSFHNDWDYYCCPDEDDEDLEFS